MCKIVTGKLLNNRESSLVLYEDLEGWDRETGQRRKREESFIYIYFIFYKMFIINISCFIFYLFFLLYWPESLK